METTAPATTLQRIQAWLPRGDTLDDEAFRERHRTLSILLALHVPILAAYGIWQGYGVVHSVVEAGVAGVFLGLARVPQMPRRLKGILVSAGMVWCSAILVHFSGGVIEAHFHFFVILGFIALYQDWAAFGWAIIFTALSHGLGSQLGPELMFNHDAAIQQPWTWALIHAGMVLFAATGQVIGWRHAEITQDRATALNTQLVREQAERQASYSRIYVNLARRNQSLLHRQLSVIDELEETEEDPETLRRLFTLDHLATRVRRNAESLLVMAGENSPRRWDEAIPLSDVARAAASEIEQYQRVDVRVPPGIDVVGTAVVDVTHLLAELVENAAEFSSPSTTVVVSGEPSPNGALVTVTDRGIGMSDEDLVATNAILRDPPELDEEVIRHLGFHVVARLARKLGMSVEVEATPGGGVTAVVSLPPALLARDEPDEPTSTTPSPQLTAAIPATPVAATRKDPAPLTAAIPATPLPPPPPPRKRKREAEPVAETESAAPPVAATPPTPAVATDVPERGAEAPASGGTPPATQVTPPTPQAPSAAARPPADPAPSAPSGPRPLFMANQPPRTATNGEASSPAAAPSPEPRTSRAAGATTPPTTPPVAPTPPVASGANDNDVDPLFDRFFTPADPATPTATGDGHEASGNGNGHRPNGDGSVASGNGQVSPSEPAPDRTPSGLPRRTPAASLAAELRDVGEQRSEPEPPPTPPEARQALSAFQAGGRAARATAPPPPPPSAEDHERAQRPREER